MLASSTKPYAGRCNMFPPVARGRRRVESKQRRLSTERILISLWLVSRLRFTIESMRGKENVYLSSPPPSTQEREKGLTGAINDKSVGGDGGGCGGPKEG